MFLPIINIIKVATLIFKFVSEKALALVCFFFIPTYLLRIRLFFESSVNCLQARQFVFGVNRVNKFKKNQASEGWK